MSSNEITEQEAIGTPDDQLAFSRIKDEIEAKAKAQYDKIVSNGNEEAKEIKKASENQAAKIKNEILGQANRETDNIKVREISRKKLSIKMDYLATREQIFDEIQVEAKSKIQKFTQSKDYSNFLSNLLEESCVSIGGGDLRLHLRKEDKSLFTKDALKGLASKMTKQTNLETKIELDKSNLQSLGGLKLVRSDSKLFIDNTFEKRLERANEDIRIELLGLLS